MNITRITKKSGNKYELIIDNKKHIIYDDVLLKYHILKPGEITKEVYDEITKSNSKEEVYTKILKYITFKMRSEREVREKLFTFDIDGNTIEEILARLRENGYLNNSKYMEAFINDSLNLTLYGPNKITSNLIKKGFSINTIKKSLDIIPFETWSIRCSKIVDKKLKNLKNGSNRATIGKLRVDLINNGYDDVYFSEILNNIHVDDTKSMEKEYEIIKNKLSKKYSGDKLEYMVKQKLYSKGYDTRKLNM